MKKVLLIARAKTLGAKQKAVDFAHRLQSELTDCEVYNCEISELVFEISPYAIRIYHPKKSFDVADFDLVIVRHIGSYAVEAHALTLYCSYHSIRYTDSYLNRHLLDNKISTSFLLWTNGIKNIPHSLYGPTGELKKRFKEFGEKVIVKDNNGSKGRLNFVVSSSDELQKICDEHPDKFFIMQEMIPNDSDLRILTLGYKVRLIIRRSSGGKSHLNNTSQGGNAEIVNLSSVEKSLIKMSVAAAQICKLEVAGVDIITDKVTGKHYVLEINNAPQISSGSFTDEKVLVYGSMIKELIFKKTKEKTLIGRAELITIPDTGAKLHARVDTGAKTSSIWATNVRVADGKLHASIVADDAGDSFINQVYDEYETTNVSSSMGHIQTRYKIKLTTQIKGRKIKSDFTLSDRSTQVYPALIGRSILKKGFVVDVNDGDPLVEAELARSNKIQSQNSKGAK